MNFLDGCQLIGVFEPSPVDYSMPEPDGEPIPITKLREHLTASRIESLDKPGIYLDRSPTGSGKSTADQAAFEQLANDGELRALVVHPDHAGCAELEDELQAAGFEARAYRGRFTEGEKQNCWNSLADHCQRIGLPVATAVCPFCEEQSRCLRIGYLADLEYAKNAEIQIATHKRAIFNGLENLATGCRFVSIHEDSLNVIAPVEVLTLRELDAAGTLLERLLNEPTWLDWFGHEERRTPLLDFTNHLADVIDALRESIESATGTNELAALPEHEKPNRIESMLFKAMREDQRQQPINWRVLLALVTGQPSRAGIIVEERHQTKTIKQLVVVFRNLPSQNAATWLCDATGDQTMTEAAIDRKVRDITLQERLEAIREVIQVPTDVTKRTSQRTVNGLIRGAMIARPDGQRIGIICHREHKAGLRKLEPMFADRIAKVEHFGSGHDRGSNVWIQECDGLIVCGTPRVGTEVIQAGLIRCGYSRAAKHSGNWGPWRWEALTESRGRRVVQGYGYRQEDWRFIHWGLVRAALSQAIGRGRSNQKTGIPVLVFSNEECGCMVTDETKDIGEFTDKNAETLTELSAVVRYIDIYTTTAVSTAEISQTLGIKGTCPFLILENL